MVLRLTQTELVMSSRGRWLLARLTSSALKSNEAWEKLERAWQGELKDAEVLNKSGVYHWQYGSTWG